MIEITKPIALNFFELKLFNCVRIISRYYKKITLRYQLSHLKSIGSSNKFHNSIFISGHENLSLGSNNFIGSSVIFSAYAEIIIGDYCAIAAGCKFISGNHGFKLSNIPINLQEINSSPIIVGNNVWFGYDAIILPGVSIGSGCVIGAGSVVTRSAPENSIVAGVPAIIIGYRN